MAPECNHRGGVRNLTSRPVFNRTTNQKLWPCIAGLRQGGKTPPHISLIGEPPDNILTLLMTLCQAFSHNFPQICTRLILEYEIKFYFFKPVNQNPDQSPNRPFHPFSKQYWCPCHLDPLSHTVLPGVSTLLLNFSTLL